MGTMGDMQVAMQVVTWVAYLRSITYM